MHPPILRCLVPGAVRAAGPLAEPGEIAPVPAVLAIEALVAYLRTVDPHREDRRTWDDFVVDNEIRDAALLGRCATALESARRAARARMRIASPGGDPPQPPWQLRLRFSS